MSAVDVHQEPAPVFLTIAETAELLRVSQDLVSDLIAQGLLPAAALGRRKVVPRIAIDQIVGALLDQFDPRQVAARLAAAVPATPETSPFVVAGTGTTGPTSRPRGALPAPDLDAPPGAPSVVPLRR